ncbi:MAG: helix-turn-helix domain-containing protein [Verrucomicrobia bacterium]|jgi:AraC-like DNA-binding protein|nr:helix-turn-helix domain-containing protein [Verrucomicrobiota bacterium]MBT7067163.1 helix-turn-helix domain-containing protein [Verrucomicrobiota bacterium]MBT7701699.1 helix-turn-helix domain-containing protein [Verrucomicrobiota bacterium]
MKQDVIDQLVASIRISPVFAKLETMARELAGVVLLIYVRHGDRIQELYASGRPAVLPDFCRIIRGSSPGRKRCATCRQLIAFGASYRGLAEFSCHGGVSVVAAPGDDSGYDPAESIVVASCAFAHADQVSGWKAARAHAHDLPVDLKELKRAYAELPVLTEQNVALVNAIIDVAASTIDEIRKRLGTAPSTGQGVRREEADLELRMGDALQSSRAKDFRRGGDATGEALVRLVMAMISRDPGLPFSVANVSRASRITPNYFSSLFRKHAGQTFVSFLAEQRIELAKTALRDLRLSVGEVAERAGFNDSSYFGRCFKRVAGVTPAQWRLGPQGHSVQECGKASV